MKKVRKLLPCSLFDLKGIESWLEEMAAQGLIFERFTYHQDGVVFLWGEPQAIRYRADPMGEYDDGGERKELYEQAGWTFQCSIPSLFYLFSCADPEMPEFHTDPQVLSYAIGQTIRRCWLWRATPLLIITPIYLWFMLNPRYQLIRILESDLYLWFSILFWITLFVTAWQFWLLYRARRSLAMGDQPKARIRWPRPPYVLLVLLFWGFEAFITFQNSPVYHSADMATRDWPALIQLEETGDRQADQVTENQAYIRSNSSLKAPVQETWHERDIKFWQGAMFHSELDARYIQTRSPALATKVFDSLKKQQNISFKSHSGIGTAWTIREYTGFSDQDHPELDRLTVARFRRDYQDGFCFIAQRSDQVLCVDYSGFGELEPCLELYLETTLAVS